MKAAAYIGIDLGTSGCRALAIDRAGGELAERVRGLPPPVRDATGGSTQDPEIWWQAVMAVLRDLVPALDGYRPRALSVDATSATLLLTDASGAPLGPALMYDDRSGSRALEAIAAAAPPDTAVHSASSSLAKLTGLAPRARREAAAFALHQADWVLGRITGRMGTSDEHNCLKLGYDAVRRTWPEWLGDPRLGIDRHWLPEVVPAGTPLGPILPGLAKELGLPPDLLAVAGTTDSTASVLAAGVCAPGDAVTCLGSTLVVKVVAARPVFSAGHGVYSHRLGDHWLAGGASNSGGAALQRFFTAEEMAAMEDRLDPDNPTGLDFYPLPRPGERFPVEDPAMAPRVAPRPKDPVRFFQGLLEGIGAIERRGYQRLSDLGAPYPCRVLTIGGGAGNRPWQRIRERLLGVPVTRAAHRQAAYGAALLARSGAEGTAPTAGPRPRSPESPAG